MRSADREYRAWNDDAAVLECFALGNGRQGVLFINRGGVVAAPPAAIRNAFGLGDLCAVGDEEDVGKRVDRCVLLLPTALVPPL